MINPLQSALSSALAGIRGATQEQAAAAQKIERATLATPDSANGSAESMASPELYAAVTEQLQARTRFSASLEVLKTADRMLAETIRTL